MKIVVGVTGASSAVLAKRLLEILKEKSIEVHLVVSNSAKKVMRYENIKLEELKQLASHYNEENEFDASIASGSYKTDGMVIIPCSMKTLAGVATGYSDNLILRAADVCLKQDRRLVLVPRETPLSYIHIKNMLTAKTAGATILPPNLTFYQEPKSLEDMIDFTIGKILDAFDIEHSLYKRWQK